MKHPDPVLGIPLYVKSEPDMKWPEEDSFYLLTRSGLFLCRNHAFFRSCVPARTWPADLSIQQRSLTLRYPKIPQSEIERVVGFFARVGEAHGSEAAALLVWDSATNQMSTLVPEQSAGVSEGWTGHRYPIDVKYEQPLDLPAHMTIIGDVHSHVEGAAYASSTDKDDEAHRPGLHVVVGRVSREPPEFHCEVVVDGTRFEVEPAAVIESYVARRDDVPEEWMDRLTVEVNRPYYSGGWSGQQYQNGAARAEPQVEYESFEEGDWT